MRSTLSSVLIALAAGGAAPPCPPADDGGRPQAQPLEAGFNAFPPCIEVEWTPVDVQGRPPLTTAVRPFNARCAHAEPRM